MRDGKVYARLGLLVAATTLLVGGCSRPGDPETAPGDEVARALDERGRPSGSGDADPTDSAAAWRSDVGPQGGGELALPTWILDPSSSLTREYRPPGQGVRPPASRARPEGRGIPALVLREGRASARIVGLDGITGSPEWALEGTRTPHLEAGSCRSILNPESLLTSPGSWYARIVLPDGGCRGWSGSSLAVTRPPETILERYAKDPDGSGRMPDTRVESAAYLEFGGHLFLWGVERGPTPTRVVPPSPWPHRAFVVRVSPQGRAEMLWEMEGSSPVTRMDLAGVIDLTGDRVPEAVFAVRDDHGWRWIVVGGSDDGFGVLADARHTP